MVQARNDEARWNGVRCPARARRGHVESWFLKLNDPAGQRALWLKATILVKRGGAPRVAEAWAIAFDRDGKHVARKETVPFAQASFAERDLDLTVAGLRLTRGRVSGSVGSISFDLRFTTDDTPLIPFPTERLYETRLPSSKLVSPHPDSRFTGSYRVGDESVDVHGWHGMQGHNWGTKHAELYAWAHCNEWQGEPDLVLEGVTARVKVGPLLAPAATLINVRHRGVAYDFDALVRASGTIELRRWTFSATNAHAKVTGELWAETKDFVGLAYENPDGATTFCLNSKIARGSMRLSPKGRPDVIAMTRAAALEVGTKDPAHGVEMLV